MAGEKSQPRTRSSSVSFQEKPKLAPKLAPKPAPKLAPKLVPGPDPEPDTFPKYTKKKKFKDSNEVLDQVTIAIPPEDKHRYLRQVRKEMRKIRLHSNESESEGEVSDKEYGVDYYSTEEEEESPKEKQDTLRPKEKDNRFYKATHRAILAALTSKKCNIFQGSPMQQRPEISEESGRTTTLAFFLLLFVISFIYAYVVLAISKEAATLIIALPLGGYLMVKIVTAGIHYLKNRNILKPQFNKKERPPMFVCIPAYREKKEAFQTTISSVANSKYPKNQLYMIIIIDGETANDHTFSGAMEILTDNKSYDYQHKTNDYTVRQGSYCPTANADPSDLVPYTLILKKKNRGKRHSQWLFVHIVKYINNLKKTDPTPLSSPTNKRPSVNRSPSPSPQQGKTLRNVERRMQRGEFDPTQEEIPPIDTETKETIETRSTSDPVYILFPLKREYMMFVDSDTGFHKETMNWLIHKIYKDPDAAGVCARLEINNYSGFRKVDFLEKFLLLTRLPVIGYQIFEYHFNQAIGKRAESLFGSVTCLPGACCILKAECLIQAEDEDRFFSRETEGIIAKNLYDLGEDRTLTIKFLEEGKRCYYEPSAVAYTECPGLILQLILQRRRWNNSTLINLGRMLLKKSLWGQPRVFPVMILTLVDFIGSLLLPTTSALLLVVTWGPLFRWINEMGNLNINHFRVIEVLILSILIITIVSDITTSQNFYVLTFMVTGFLMIGSVIFLVKDLFVPIIIDFIADPATHWPFFVALMILPVIYTISGIAEPKSLLFSLCYIFMFPTVGIILPVYSFLNMYKFNWGTR